MRYIIIIKSSCKKASDYTIMVSNIPKSLDIDYKEEIKKYFSKYNVKIESMDFLFNLKYYKEQYAIMDDLII